MTRANGGAAVRSRPLARLAACAALAGLMCGGAAGCGGDHGSAAGEDAPSAARMEASGRATLERDPMVKTLLAKQGASVADARPVRFGRLASQAWVATTRKGSCMFLNMASPTARDPSAAIATQCSSRARRDERGLVATFGSSDGTGPVTVYGLAPAGARKAVVVGSAGTQVVDVVGGRFGVVVTGSRFVQFVTDRGLTPKVSATTARPS